MCERSVGAGALEVYASPTEQAANVTRSKGRLWYGSHECKERGLGLRRPQSKLHEQNKARRAGVLDLH